MTKKISINLILILGYTIPVASLGYYLSTVPMIVQNPNMIICSFFISFLTLLYVLIEKRKEKLSEFGKLWRMVWMAPIFNILVLCVTFVGFFIAAVMSLADFVTNVEIN